MRFLSTAMATTMVRLAPSSVPPIHIRRERCLPRPPTLTSPRRDGRHLAYLARTLFRSVCPLLRRRAIRSFLFPDALSASATPRLASAGDPPRRLQCRPLIGRFQSLPAGLKCEFVNSHEKLTISSLLLTSLPAPYVCSTTVDDGSPTPLVKASVLF